MNKLINFLITYNESIIQWLILSIVLISAYLLGVMLFSKKKEEAGTDLESSELKKTLTEILAHTQVAASHPVVASAGAVDGAQQAVLQKELDENKAKLVQLTSELDQIKNQPSDVKTYMDKIKELEGKLAEYEILEDDIADLSVYKEENAKLKDQLEKLKVSGGAVVAAAQAPATEAAGESIVREFAETIEKTKDIVEPDPLSSLEPATTSGPIEPVEGDELVNEFASAMESQKTQPITEPMKEETVADADEEQSADMGDDILAEFAASLEGGEPKKEKAAAAGDFDTDKMLAEMADLQNVEDDGSSSLEEAIDTDKMASEASHFESKE